MHFGVDYEFGTKRCSNCSRLVFVKKFWFFLLKSYHFFRFHAFLKMWKLKGNFSDNLGQNICGLFQVLAHFLFNLSEIELHYYHKKLNVQVFKQLKIQGLRKLANFNKIPKMLKFDGQFQLYLWNSKVWCFLKKKIAKAQVQTLHRKTHFA